ncbi:hypothetical protein F2C03_06905 [Salmonella enterica]|nr:hypothetical protein [Salmonella enterica]
MKSFLKSYLSILAYSFVVQWIDDYSGLLGAHIFGAMFGVCWMIFHWYKESYEINRDVEILIQKVQQERKQAALSALNQEVNHG